MDGYTEEQVQEEIKKQKTYNLLKIGSIIIPSFCPA